MTDELSPPESIDSAEVLKFPFKLRRDPERVLHQVSTYEGCRHKRFLVNEKLEYVECADCKEKLSPMWVLGELSHRENRYHELHQRYHDELKRLGERSRTKCQHCGQMTRISR